MWKLFLKFGRVGEVYIPKKLDKRGSRFGFVKFKEMEDVHALGDKLRDVWLGSFKLRVNRSRFARSEAKETHSQKAPFECTKAMMGEMQVGRSFKTALVGATLADGYVVNSPVMKVSPNEALCKELQSTVVGLLAWEKDVRHIQTTLNMEGFQSVIVT
ncbi:hypothetical protein TSUD_348430 [Trifolium subterraneum]|nr:hypothetical protein TSUD_348430 [Trifolium subterraneum]